MLMLGRPPNRSLQGEAVVLEQGRASQPLPRDSANSLRKRQVPQ